MKAFRYILCFFIISGCSKDSVIYGNASPLVSAERIYNPGRLFSAFERVGLGPMRQQIPAHGQGMLLASWSPSDNPHSSPTFVLLHGGGGVGTTTIQMALDLRREYNANVLILDSHWSRGRRSNFGTDFRSYGPSISVTDRVYDLLAAGQWLSNKDIDHNRIYPLGESQGGMVVMRAFTEGAAFSNDITHHFSQGIALWPACYWWDIDHSISHPVGPFSRPVIIFSGGRDYGSPISECPAYRYAARHVHWEEATHAWMFATHGLAPREDGNCNFWTERERRRYAICYSESRTQETWMIVRSFIGSTRN